jgi:hypothetical protein
MGICPYDTMQDFDNWRHKSGYHLNADGKSIEYEHIDRQLLAIVEGMVNEDDITDIDFQYYVVIFDTNNSPYATKEPHRIFGDKDTAKERLYELMEKHE